MPALPRDASARPPEVVTAALRPALPTRWSEEEKHRHAALHLSEDGRKLAYIGTSSNELSDSAAARTDRPIPVNCKNGVYFYEVKVLHKGDKGHISVGFATGDARLRLPGWEKGSWGYHADDGWVYDGAKEGKAFAPAIETGDIVGCGVDLLRRRIFFTKNSSFLGIPFENLTLDFAEDGPGLYPCVGMRHPGESIHARFGDVQNDEAWFGFDLQDYTRICTFEEQ